MPVHPIPPLDTLEKQIVVLLRERLLETSVQFESDTDLYTLGMDSMAIMQLLILIEEEYGVSLPESSLTRQNFSTAAQLARLIRAQSDVAAP
jgi:acyl carrier protein